MTSSRSASPHLATYAPATGDQYGSRPSVRGNHDGQRRSGRRPPRVPGAGPGAVVVIYSLYANLRRMQLYGACNYMEPRIARFHRLRPAKAAEIQSATAIVRRRTADAGRCSQRSARDRSMAEVGGTDWPHRESQKVESAWVSYMRWLARSKDSPDVRTAPSICSEREDPLAFTNTMGAIAPMSAGT
jgi:hypothetical protein